MSTFKEFEKTLQADRELAERYEAERKRIIDAGEATDDASVVAQAAEAMGFSFTAADVERAYADLQKMDDTEMDRVAGGVDESNAWCIMIDNCYTAFFHEDTDPNDVYGTPSQACWKDYCCIIINH